MNVEDTNHLAASLLEKVHQGRYSTLVKHHAPDGDSWLEFMPRGGGMASSSQLWDMEVGASKVLCDVLGFEMVISHTTYVRKSDSMLAAMYRDQTWDSNWIMIVFARF